jgi:hypothetical protein
MSHSDGHFHYTTDRGEVKLLLPGLGRDDGQRLRVACYTACRALLRRAMLILQWYRLSAYQFRTRNCPGQPWCWLSDSSSVGICTPASLTTAATSASTSN